MDAASALADLTEISSQVDAAVLLDEGGAVLASTLEDDARSERIARTAVELLHAADERLGREGRSILRLEASLREGSVFAVREAGRSIVATTSPSPTSGLVLYDLKACLRSLEQADEPAKPEPRRKAEKQETADA